ncbi:hypothetical protein EV644_1195 [Kribbella orskensis]|uniref:Uncharacterized protein n=1 Tax=Kribbella orskensis TaxID=2512216 RepID=A0ABY2BBC2_9ACTN|nr:hypothetical protein EV642_120137 [Kribbella sp. VKM Ac-2500]TCO14893.1 hypothetical protein EV644_1195 [Kribbella orskensis]
MLAVGVGVHGRWRELSVPAIVAVGVADTVEPDSAARLEDSKAVMAANDDAVLVQEADREETSNHDRPDRSPSRHAVTLAGKATKRPLMAVRATESACGARLRRLPSAVALP